MKLYNSIGPNPRIVRMFMAEKGIEMPRQTVDLRKGENRAGRASQAQSARPDADARARRRQLSVGDHRDLRISRGEKSCAADDRGTAEQRAECRMWTRRVDLNICEPLANGYRFGEALKFFEKRIPCAPEASPGLKMIAQNRLQWLNGQIAGKEYLCGNALHARRHPAVLLARFRRPGRPAAGSRQRQYRGMVRPCRRAAIGEGVRAQARVPDAVQCPCGAPQSRDPPAQRGPRISSASRRKCDALRCIRGTMPLDYITTGASGSSFGPVPCAGKYRASCRDTAAMPRIDAAAEISAP